LLVTVGDRTFRVHAVEQPGSWLAHAVSLAHGHRCSEDMTAPTETEAVHRVRRWLEWQRHHAMALAELQNAERAYHRTITDLAFASQADSEQAPHARRTALALVDAARAKLDAMRACRPR
jgi:predicted alpha/beta hydrolase